MSAQNAIFAVRQPRWDSKGILYAYDYVLLDNEFNQVEQDQVSRDDWPRFKTQLERRGINVLSVVSTSLDECEQAAVNAAKVILPDEAIDDDDIW